MNNNNEIYRAIVRMAIRKARQITDDQEALTVKVLYKNLHKQVGKELKEGEYVQYDNKLYRVLKTHIVEKAEIDNELYIEVVDEND